MTLTEFLLARIAEDEATAQEVRPHEYLTTRDGQALGRGDAGGYSVVTVTSGRVLAECEAKRRIVEEHRPDTALGRCGCCWLDDLGAWEPFPCPTLRALALPYADHADFREEWRA